MNVSTAEELFSSSLNFILLDQTSVSAARERFDAFRDAGVIKEGSSFEDDVWYTTDEYSNVGLHFSFDREKYDEYYAKGLNLSFDEFVSRVKSYITTLFSKTALVSMENVILDLRHITANDPVAIGTEEAGYTLTRPAQCSDFFSMLPDTSGDFTNDIMDMLDICSETRIAKQKGPRSRSLAAFDTYAVFNDIINDYWSHDLNTEDRLFYLPLYIWWNLTGCIPLRPREFLLTTRDCLSTDAKGKHYITLRRNRLKGSKREKSYKISADYFTTTFRIPDKLYEEINGYLKATDKYDSTDIDTLFVTDPHYRKWKQGKHSNSRFLTYVNMVTILRYFYSEVICGIYGYRIISDEETRHLEDKEIQRIRLGDARHVALINLMQEGGTPATAMFLAGHTNEEMAAHYYSNLETMIECQTYREYRKYIGSDKKYQISVQGLLPPAEKHVSLADGGTCYSSAYMSGSITDCRKACGENGEIGYCLSCRFYRGPSISFFEGDDIYRRDLKDDCTALVEAVDRVRHDKGAVEDIGEAMLKVQESSTSYRNYLMQKKMYDRKKTQES